MKPLYVVKIALLSCIMLTSVLGFSQTASIQIAHNSPDDAVAVVDVYANGFELMGDLEFRSSSSFTNVPAGVDIEIALAPGSSNSAADAVFTTTVNLTEDENYIIVAGGIISATGYDPAPAFDLEIYPMARLSSAADTITDVLIHHGATDAPTVDIFEIGVGAGLIVDDLSYLDFAGYLELDLDSIDYELEVKNDADSSTIATFPLPLADLGLGGEAITVYASGFLDPSVNSDGPDFGLFATTAAGGPFIEIPLVSVPKALVQIAHNAPDSSLATVDVFADGLEILSDVEFRSATPFLEFLAGVDIEIAIAPGAANDVDSAFYSETINLTDSAVYIMIADGMIDSDYSPFQEFEINTYDLGRIDGLSADTTDILIHHGATDAPTVDVFEVLNCDVDQIHNNVSFGNFAGYYQLPTLDYELEVVNNNSVSYGSYAAPLSTLGLGGQAITVYASGFLDPSTTDTDAPFGLFASTSAGGPFLELPAANVRPSNDEVCNATEILDDASVGVYSNLNAIQTCGEEVITPQGGDCSSSNGWCSQDAVIDNSVWFKFVASTNTAIVSTCAAGNTIDTQIAIFEASDCEDYSTFNLIAANDDIAGGCTNGSNEFASSLLLPELTAGNTYWILVDSYQGEQGDFALSVDGFWTAQVQVIHNSADAAAEIVDVYIDGNLAVNDFEFRTATPFLMMDAEVEISIAIAPGTSTSVADALTTFPLTLEGEETYIVVADGIVSSSGYSPAPALELAVYDMGREEAANPSNTDILIHHGVTDAPAIDIVEVGFNAGTIVDDATYTDFAGYFPFVNSDNLELQVQTGDNSVIVDTYPLPTSFQNLDGLAATVVASGFLDPSANSNGPAFGLWLAKPNGGNLIELAEALSIDELNTIEVSVFPNPTTDIVRLQYASSFSGQLHVLDARGRVVLSEAVNGLTGEVDMRSLPSGTYSLLTLGTDSKAVTTVVKN